MLDMQGGVGYMQFHLAVWHAIVGTFECALIHLCMCPITGNISQTTDNISAFTLAKWTSSNPLVPAAILAPNCGWVPLAARQACSLCEMQAAGARGPQERTVGNQLAQIGAANVQRSATQQILDLCTYLRTPGAREEALGVWPWGPWEMRS